MDYILKQKNSILHITSIWALKVVPILFPKYCLIPFSPLSPQQFHQCSSSLYVDYSNWLFTDVLPQSIPYNAFRYTFITESLLYLNLSMDSHYHRPNSLEWHWKTFIFLEPLTYLYFATPTIYKSPSNYLTYCLMLKYLYTCFQPRMLFLAYFPREYDPIKRANVSLYYRD